MKTRWMRRLLWLAGFACLWLNLLDDPPLRTGPYLQDVTQQAATVAKIAAAPVEASLTVFDEAGAVVMTAASPLQRRHAMRVSGLQPGTRYSYLLTTSDGTEERGSLRTAPDHDDAPVRFTCCGDSGDQPWWVWLQRTPALHLPAAWGWFPTSRAVTAIGAALADYAPDFALHLGDVIYPKGRHAHYSSGFFRPFGELIRNAPLYAVLGNHDVMDAAGQQHQANFRGPQNDLTGDGRCFSFAWGPVRIIALDCNTWLVGDRYQAGHPSQVFLERELSTNTEPWMIVASHFPIRSASRQGDSGELMLALLPELERLQVSLYFSGHDHCYQRFGPDDRFPVPLVVSGGGGKELYDINRSSRTAPLAAALEKAFHWCAVEVRGNVLELRATSLDGRELDRFTLHLPDGASLEALRGQNPGRAGRIDKILGR